MDDVDQQERSASYNCRGGDGKDPGPHDASGNAPSDGGKTVKRTDADDRPGNGVSGADWDSGESSAEERDGSGALSAESADWFELGDFLAHCVDDAPSSEIRSGSDGSMGGEDDGPVEVAPASQACPTWT